MSLRPGIRLGVYEIVAPIGAGGMGEVYRARDTRLDREVAIKVLPDAVAGDPERLARFDREAKVVASLNHPNIAQVYGLEDNAIVMELVIGSTLTVPQPLDTALEYARQIAEALEAAHDKGITHRDLKPANIMITAEGVVKVLDFGLAAVPARSAAAGNAANSPTFTMAATQVGMIMGTAAYMSPEQAAGKAVDKRSDIWSFGVVLWEMLTGNRLFDGETVSHTLADVLRAPIEFGQLPPSTPAPVAQLVQRCLDRNVKTRLQAIGEARIAIQKFQADPAPAPSAIAPPRSKPSRAGWAVAALSGIAAAALGAVAYRHLAEPVPSLLKASVLLEDKMMLVPNSPPAISPDARKLAFSAIRDGRTMLWVRDLDSMAPRSLPGTEGATDPFWSPDSRSIAFTAEGRLKRLDLSSGGVMTLASEDSNVHGATWSSRGVIVYPLSGTSGLFRVPASGGEATPATTLDEAAGEISHRLPFFLPDGRHFIYTVRNVDQAGKSAVYVGDLDSKQRTLLLRGEGHAQFVTEGGYLVYALKGSTDSILMAQRMDPVTLRLSGEPFPVVERVDLSSALWAQHQFSVARDGTLAYTANGMENNARLSWFDRTGHPAGSVGNVNPLGLAISPDGKTVAFGSTMAGPPDIWLYDVSRGTSSRLTFSQTGGGASSPAWAPDGKSVIFAQFVNARPATIVRMSITGGAAVPLSSGPWGTPPRPINSLNWSRDGKYVVGRLNPSGPTGSDIWALALDPPGQVPQPYLASPANETDPSIAPGSDWVAYSSEETRRFEVYVQSFPKPGIKHQVSVNGGMRPVWRRDGKEIYFIAPDQKMMAATVRKTGDRLEIGTPEPLFDSNMVPRLNGNFDVSADGRFLIPVQVQTATLPITLVMHWQPR
jgi:eukaryotic-like serine/threonine-protein kinase